MNQVLKVIVLCTVLSEVVYGKFPTDITKCHAGDSVCLPKAITTMLSSLGPGRRDLNLPSIEPLLINSIEIAQGQDRPVSIDLKFSNLELFGLVQGVVTRTIGFEADAKNSKFEVFAKLPSIQLFGDYKVNGKILVLPIQGVGKCNITLDDMDIQMKWTPEVHEKNGKEYMNAKNFKLSFDTTRFSLYLGNLFNGDKALGDNMNMFINENWKEILDELKPELTEAFSQIFESIINNVFTKYPYSEFWLTE